MRIMRLLAVGVWGTLCLCPSGCGESTGPEAGKGVDVVSTSPSFTLTLDYLGHGEGEVEVEVTNLNDIPLYVFSSCGHTRFRLKRRVQNAWIPVSLAAVCMKAMRPTEVPAGGSHLFNLNVLTAAPPVEGEYRVDLYWISWNSDQDEFLESTPLPYQDRHSNEFQIVVESGEVNL